MSLPDIRDLRWQLKSWLRWSPALRSRRAMHPAKVNKHLNAGQRERLLQLQQNYVIEDWPRLCNAIEYRENLYMLDLLTQHLAVQAHVGKGLDIGCRNFSHLPALSALRPSAWDGVELDAHARYWSGHTRRACGEWMARQRPQCRYIVGSLLDLETHYDVIVWVLPFVLPEPLRRWGLPERYFQPAALLRHALTLLEPEGTMFIVNQGESEADEQRRLLTGAGVAFEELGELHSVFSPFRNQRFGWLIKP